MQISNFFKTAFALSMLCLISSALHAQKITPKFRLDTHAIRRITWNVVNEKKTAKTLRSWYPSDPARTLVVILGRTRDDWNVSYLRRINRFGSWESFVRAGGALLVATDQRFDDFRHLTGCRVSGFDVIGNHPMDRRSRRWHAPLAPNALYRGLNQCIAIQPGRGTHEFFIQPNLHENKFKLRLITNRPSYLQGLPRGRGVSLSVLPRFPKGCYYYGGIGYQWDRSQPQPFGLNFEMGRGRVVLLADHSIFINEMMLQEDRPFDRSDDIGNVAFAYNVMEWLCEQKRDRVLFVVDGEIKSELDIPLIEIPLDLKEQEKLILARGNAIIAKLNEKSREANAAIIRALGRGPGRALFGRGESGRNFLLVVILALTLSLIAYSVFRLRKASYRLEPGVPLLATALERAAPEPEVVTHRLASMVTESNLATQGRMQARELFEILHGDVWKAGRPRILTQGSWWARLRLRGRVSRMWNLASGEATSMSTKQFRRLLHEIHDLRQLWNTGQWQLEWE